MTKLTRPLYIVALLSIAGCQGAEVVSDEPGGGTEGELRSRRRACGDGVCGDGETCSSCATDCGTCAPLPPGIDCTNAATWPAEWTTYEDQVLTFINDLRRKGGTCGIGGTDYPPVAPLVMNAQLRQAARCFSLDMAKQNFYSHTGPDGSTPLSRMSAAGYVPTVWAENIEAHYLMPVLAVNGWWNSIPNCTNIMNGNLVDTGIGYAYNAASTWGDYWTQDFARR